MRDLSQLNDPAESRFEVSDPIAELQQKIEDLTARVEAVEEKASLGERAYHLQQPIG